MTETNMPVAEVALEDGREVQSYELAFHILPTVAEGEVKSVFDIIKAHITNLGGTLGEEEVPARFELAYEIVKPLEGRNRKFNSAYFGWVRFEIEAAKMAELTEAVELTKEILRHLITRLSKVEEANPFYFHPAIADRVVENIEIAEEVAAEEVVTEEAEVVAEVKIEDGEAAEETV
jgi:ribosomal protein S6